MNEPSVTRWWWVRHAVVPFDLHKGCIYGQTDIACDTSDAESFHGLASILPEGAHWVTSNLGRAKQTAAAIQAAGLHGPKPVEDPQFAEQSFGDWHGTSWDELRAAGQDIMQTFWDDPAHNRPPGGESFADVVARVGPRIEAITAANPGRDIIAVTHGGTIRAALANALGVDAATALAFRVDNLSVTLIEHVADGILGGRGAAWRVSMVNRPSKGPA